MTRHGLFVRLAEKLYRIERPLGNVPMGLGAPSDVASVAEACGPRVEMEDRHMPLPAIG
jgi:hypothetical protein